ncbi:MULTISPECIES: hypothetical protein [unclassified Peribacillus]|uniref:hypothetical protein n=1 Tax=unclassified Peribacillus TaxID=2675266 RepID=UPI00191290A8|nr:MULTISPECIES: hypothetical protein [unclassified Peribacillus]MBK5445875.1 hypothetical protein [Peribacillus sp. TH24]WMX57264.1 hypothetical protein RE409_08630 [Peribacillus sp. R9-11]
MKKEKISDESQFLKLLKPIQQQLLIQLLLKEGQLLLLAVAVWSFLLLFIARIMVIPFILRYFFIGLICLLAFFLYRVVKRKPDKKMAALLFNKFVPDDRVVTGFAFLGNAGELETLQLRDAIRHMKIHQEKVLSRKKRWFYPKWLTSALCLAVCVLLFIFYPNKEMKEAQKLEKEVKIVEEVKKELEKKANDSKEPAVEKALKEVKKKMALEKDGEKALEALAKQSSELQLKEVKQKEKQKLLEEWQEQTKKSGFSELAKALAQKDMSKVEKELQKLNEKWDELPDEQKQALESLTEQENPLSEEELEALIKQLEEAMKSAELVKQLAEANQAVHQAGTQLQNQLSQNGMPSSQLAFTNNKGAQGSKAANQPLGQPSTSASPNGQPNLQSGNSAPNQQGQGGQGQQGGQGGQQGVGQGQQSGQGGNGGGGKGGTKGGKGQGTREMLTIPEMTDGKQNTETDNGQLGEGSGEEEEADGPVLKGNLRNYEEVYQQYENSYRQSTERLRLPSDLNNLVKNYFNKLDPER